MLKFRMKHVLVLKLFLYLVLLASMNCQSNILSGIVTTNASISSDILEISSATTAPANTQAVINASTTAATTTKNITTDNNSTDDVLLSSHEFVDFTEAPTLLFDGTSIENDTTPTTNNADVTSSPVVPSTSNANTTDSSNETNVTIPTTEPPIGTIVAATTIMPESGEEEESETEGNDEGKDDTKGNEPPFSPPQNVSQYMDYIERLFHDLRHQITDLFEPHIPRLIRTSQMVQLSGSCSYDMLRMALALRQFEPWALRMIDSSGKVPEGIFEGSFTALGSYDECLNTIFASASEAATQNGQSHLSPNSALSSSNQQQQNSQVNNLTQGKYCLVNVSPFLPPKPPVDRVESMFQEEANRRNYTKDDQFSRLSPMFYYMKFRIGVCIPSTCVDSDLESIANALSSSLRLNITIPHCRVKQSQSITSHQLVSGLVFATVLALVIGATMMDYSRRKSNRLLESEEFFVLSVADEKQDDKDGSARMPVLLRKTTDSSRDLKSTFSARFDNNWSWMSFSCFTNYRLYFKHKNPIIKRPRESSYRHTTKLEGTTTASARILAQDESTLNIKCLNGIRVLSLCWVIIANSYITLDPRATKLLTKTREAPKDFIFQMIAQASLAIETFFFLSGVLMSLSFAKKLNKPTYMSDGESGKEGSQEKKSKRSYILEWVHFYIHRYIRMTPATMLVIAFTMFAYSYGDGPLWFEATHKAHQSCNKNWWRHLLHIANYIDTRQMCFIHYWYIAADMQLFLFAPILMFLLYQKRRIGYALATLIGLMSIGSVFYTTYIRNLPPTLLFYNSDPESRREFGNTIMTKPLTHALPYMVGMLVGKWLTSSRREIASQSWIENERSRSIASICGLLATIVALAEIFLPYKWNNSHLPTRLLSSAYAALFRFGWSLVLAYIVVSCRHRQTKRCHNELNSESNCCNCKQQSSRFDNLERSNRIIQEHKGHHHQNDLHQHQQQRQKLQRQHELHQTREQQSPETGTLFCLCGSGGNLLNRLLSLSIFTDLSKLSFVAYLIHLPLMSVFVAQTRGLFAFSHTLVIHLALSYLFMTFILSFLLVHIIEFPFLTFERYFFEKLFYNRGKRGKNSDSQIATEKDSAPNSNSMENCQSMQQYCIDKLRDGNRLRMNYQNQNQNQSQNQHHQQVTANDKQYISSEKYYVSERL